MENGMMRRRGSPKVKSRPEIPAADEREVHLVCEEGELDDGAATGVVNGGLELQNTSQQSR